MELQDWRKEPCKTYKEDVSRSVINISKRKLTAVCSHQTRIGNLDAHLI